MAAPVNLIGSVVCKNERGRYLQEAVTSLLTYCDSVCAVDDASTDGSAEWLEEQDRVYLLRSVESTFFQHEGRFRQRALDHVLRYEPTHIATVDLDEFVSAGGELRARLESEPDVPVWSLEMQEVWRADEHLFSREDGGWRSHPVPFLWKAPRAGERWTMRDRKLACGRVPTQVMGQGARAKPTGVSLLHFGWANPAERQARYDRYTKHDGGRFHASAHLKSIMWPATRIRLQQRAWPKGETFDRLRERFMVTA
ncbi:MAG: glycosyltransferase family 2 protein [Gemmatimonadota bacterium]